MSKREEQSKRQKILTAAVSLFRTTHDVKKVSLEAIARAAKVSPTTIYNNFGDRDSLLYEVVRVLVEENIARNREMIHSDVPFHQKLAGIFNSKLELASAANEEVISKLVSQDATIAPYITEIYKNEIRPLWEEMLADGKKQGYIDDSLDSEVLLIYLDALKIGFSAREDLLQNFPDKVDLIKQLSRIMFYGFLKKDIGLFKKEGD